MPVSEAQKRARERYMKASAKRKEVVFFPTDRDLIAWFESRDEPFATYVKRLIREDMGRGASE